MPTVAERIELAKLRYAKFDPSQRRDDSGRWTDGSGASNESGGEHASAPTHVTDTPEFKSWFGDSKIVDGDGKPRRMYHGTNAEFDRFSPHYQGQTDDGYFGRGFYFSNNPDAAADYGDSVVPVYLQMSSPLVIPESSTWGDDSLFDTRDVLAELPGMPDGLKTIRTLPDGYEIARRELEDGDYGHQPRGNNVRYYVAPKEELWGTDKELHGEEQLTELSAIVTFNDELNGHRHTFDSADTAGLFRDIGRKQIVAAIKEAGHDGIITRDVHDNEYSEFIVFEPTQIKSAIGNSGAFDPSDERMTYKRVAPAPGQHSFVWGEEQEKLHPRAADGEWTKGVESRGKMGEDVGKCGELSSADDYKQNGTRAKAFKDWFGDWEHDAEHASKVVNADGEPQETSPIDGTGEHKPHVVYHGTALGGFDHFDKSKQHAGALFGPGFYFTEDKEVAGEYVDKEQEYKLNRPLTAKDLKVADRWFGLKATIRDALSDIGIREHFKRAYKAMKDGPEALAKMLSKDPIDDLMAKLRVYRGGVNTPEVKACYLNIRKPFDIDHPPTMSEASKELRQAVIDKYGDGQVPSEPVSYDVLTAAVTERMLLSGDGREMPDDIEVRKAVTEMLQKSGYDGITHVGGYIMGNRKHRVWIAFEPNQIKSVENRGTFDPKDDRMDYSKPHDVSGEPRDESGKWTEGGAIGHRPLHEMSREEFFNDPDLVRSHIPEGRGGYKVSYKLVNPPPGGPYVGSDILDHKPSKGDVIPSPFGKATVTAVSKAKPRQMDNMELYEGGKVAHRKAVADAIARGEIDSHPDYPELTIHATGETGPEEQSSMFDADERDPHGQKHLFDAGLPTAERRAAPEKPSPSLLEKIEDELKAKSRENEPAKGQKEMFSRRLHDAATQAVERYGWATVGGHPGEGGQHVGGTAVHFGEDGTITKGPAALKGAKIGGGKMLPPKAPDWFKSKSAKPIDKAKEVSRDLEKSDPAATAAKDSAKESKKTAKTIAGKMDEVDPQPTPEHHKAAEKAVSHLRSRWNTGKDGKPFTAKIPLVEAETTKSGPLPGEDVEHDKRNGILTKSFVKKAFPHLSDDDVATLFPQAVDGVEKSVVDPAAGWRSKFMSDHTAYTEQIHKPFLERLKAASARYSRSGAVDYYLKDATGHEHKGKGVGGGQFTSGGGGGGGASAPAPAASPPKAEAGNPVSGRVAQAAANNGVHVPAKPASAAAPADRPGTPAAPAAKPAEPAGNTAVPPAVEKAIENIGTTDQPTTAPPPGPYHAPDPSQGKAARVGVPGDALPPPPNVPLLPNLTPEERDIETKFAQMFEADPDGMADKAIAAMQIPKGQEGSLNGDGPNVFGTDDVKMLFPQWRGTSVMGADGKPELSPETKEFRSKYNTALHQTANALAKRAFVRYLDNVVAKLPEGQRNVLVTAGGVACHGRGTPVVMFDGSIREVQDVMVGDLVMGPDSSPRAVLKTHRGRDMIYRVSPNRGDEFTVNAAHVLPLKVMNRRKSGGVTTYSMDTIEMTVGDYLGKSSRFKRNSWLYKTGVEFPESPVIVDPYFLGLWLGNGTHSIPVITSQANEVADYLKAFAASIPDMQLIVHTKPDNLASAYQLSQKNSKARPGDRFGSGSRQNPLTKGLKEIGVLRNKHIPQCYIANSRAVRLKLLAGLLDTDGSLDMDKNTFEYTTKIKRMAREIQFLARSLGFGASMKEKIVKNPWNGTSGVYYRLHIGGNDLHEIPTKVINKRASPRMAKRTDGHTSRNVLHTGFSIEPIGEDEFFGFTLDKDHLYLLGDFTVTHNSGKGFAIQNVPQVKSVSQAASATWDTAGEQNSTELMWVANLCKERGIHMTATYVHAEPTGTWENPKRGVMQRASNVGRMVDARAFADSYTHGARNYAAFHEATKNMPHVDSIILDNSRPPVTDLDESGVQKIDKEGKPATKPDVVRLDAVPESAIKTDPEELYNRCMTALGQPNIPPAVKQGGGAGARIWPPPQPRDQPLHAVNKFSRVAAAQARAIRYFGVTN